MNKMSSYRSHGKQVWLLSNFGVDDRARTGDLPAAAGPLLTDLRSPCHFVCVVVYFGHERDLARVYRGA